MGRDIGGFAVKLRLELPCAALLCAAVLCGCGGRTEQPALTQTDTGITEAVSDEAAGKISLEGMTLVRGSGTGTVVSGIEKALEEKYGFEPARVTESAYAGGPAIFVKKDDNYPLQSYSIEITDGDEPKIEIIGGGKQALSYAAARFITDMLGERPYLSPASVRSDMLRLRDPCVLVSGGKYYLPCSNGNGYSCVSGSDLYTFGEPKVIFDAAACADPDFDGVGDFWAPEMCEYRGEFYLFASYRSAATGHRGTAVFRCGTPDGDYELISAGQVTPKDWDSIDGSLYVDENAIRDGLRHEWTSMPDGIGAMCASRMSADLTALEGEITTLFYASDAPWNPKNTVTDGPYVRRLEDGRLVMLCSVFASYGYCVGAAYSGNGILGPWVQQEEPVYFCETEDQLRRYEGGQARLFDDLRGRLMMSLHSPTPSMRP